MESQGYCSILVMGGFNYPSIDYTRGTVSSGPSSAAAKFYETTQDLLFFQHVTKPTRVRPDQEPSTLDYIFLSDKAAIDEVEVNAPLGKSDHVVLEWNLLLETAATHSIE